MRKKNEKENLRDEISLLKRKQSDKLIILKEQFHVVCEGMKPVNLVKNTWKELFPSQGTKSTVLGTVIGVSTGYLSKILVTGATHNPIVKVFGSLLQFAVASVVSKHPGAIQSTGEKIVRYIFKRKKEEPGVFSNLEK